MDDCIRPESSRPRPRAAELEGFGIHIIQISSNSPVRSARPSKTPGSRPGFCVHAQSQKLHRVVRQTHPIFIQLHENSHRQHTQATIDFPKAWRNLHLRVSVITPRPPLYYIVFWKKRRGDNLAARCCQLRGACVTISLPLSLSISRLTGGW